MTSVNAFYSRQKSLLTEVVKFGELLLQSVIVIIANDLLFPSVCMFGRDFRAETQKHKSCEIFKKEERHKERKKVTREENFPGTIFLFLFLFCFGCGSADKFPAVKK